MDDGSSILLDLAGVQVADVARLDDGTREVVLRTDPAFEGLCPVCGVRSRRSKGIAPTRPRDIRVGPDRPKLVWRKRKWWCHNASCKRKVFTESVPQIPPRARITARAKHALASAVLDQDRSVAAVAAEYGCGWASVHDQVEATADKALEAPAPPVAVLGIDETRRGKPKWETDKQTGERTWVDRWDTGLVDITGTGGLLAQVNGRAAADVIAWIAAQPAQWRQGVEYVAIDMSAAYAKAARLALPHTVLLVDHFHVVRKANDMLDAVRRRITLEQRGRRGRKTDPEWRGRRRLLRAMESLTSQQRDELFATLQSADPSGDIAAAWIAKELVRGIFAPRKTGGHRADAREGFYEFFTFAASCEVPEVRSLAKTVDQWRNEIATAVLTGYSNARSEGYNRIVKHIGRIAFGFRNPDNQRRRVRYACTRQQRAGAPSGPSKPPLTV